MRTMFLIEHTTQISIHLGQTNDNDRLSQNTSVIKLLISGFILDSTMTFPLVKKYSICRLRVLENRILKRIFGAKRN